MPERPGATPETPNIEQARRGVQTWKQLSEIHKFGYSHDTVFRDFVDICLNTLLSLTHNIQYPDFQERLRTNGFTGPYEERYLALVAKYRENKTHEQGERPIDFFSNAWGSLQIESSQCGEDVLGEMFMNEISRGYHGQYFTPTHVCDMMAQITGGADGETSCDPACGSGRMLLALHKINPHMRHTGIDLSDMCAKMAVLNAWLFDMHADIYCGNSLSNEMYSLWHIRKGGYVFEGNAEPLPATAHEQIVASQTAHQEPRPLIETTEDKPLEDEEIGQQVLFDVSEYTQKKKRRVK